MYNLAHAFHDYNVAFNFCRFRALAYTTLDNLRAVFFYLMLIMVDGLPRLTEMKSMKSHKRMQSVTKTGRPAAPYQRLHRKYFYDAAKNGRHKRTDTDRSWQSWSVKGCMVIRILFWALYLLGYTTASTTHWLTVTLAPFSSLICIGLGLYRQLGHAFESLHSRQNEYRLESRDLRLYRSHASHNHRW